MGILGAAALGVLIWSGTQESDVWLAQQALGTQPDIRNEATIFEVAGRENPVETIAVVDVAGDAVVSRPPVAFDAPRFVSAEDPVAAWPLAALGQDGPASASLYRPEAPAFTPLRSGVAAQPAAVGASVPAGRHSAPAAYPSLAGAPNGRWPGAGSSDPAGSSAPRGPGGAEPADPQVAAAPAAQPARAVDGRLPTAPAPMFSSAPDGPAQGPETIDLSGKPIGPSVTSASDPADDWFSPGHSPGIAQVDGDFALGGRTLLFEILGTEPGLMYDQLQVAGDVLLDSGNVVFAFINGYVPNNASDLFELILADSIEVYFDEVDFYYGFFDPKLGDPSWDLHAPKDFSLYRTWDGTSGITMTDADRTVTLQENVGTFGGLFGIQYDAKARQAAAVAPATLTEPVSQPFTPLRIPVPAPAPLLLLAAGFIWLARLRPAVVAPEPGCRRQV